MNYIIIAILYHFSSLSRRGCFKAWQQYTCEFKSGGSVADHYTYIYIYAQVLAYAKYTSMTTCKMHFHDHMHDVCAHGSTVLTNPERSEVVAERIFYALQVRTRTIKGFVHVKNIFHIMIIVTI